MIAGIAEADRALNLAITGIATALDEDDDDATDANTMASSTPVIPVPTPTMEACIYVDIRYLDLTSTPILSCLP
jgi:hypothetical protein